MPTFVKRDAWRYEEYQYGLAPEEHLAALMRVHWVWIDIYKEDREIDPRAYPLFSRIHLAVKSMADEVRSDIDTDEYREIYHAIVSAQRDERYNYLDEEFRGRFEDVVELLSTFIPNLATEEELKGGRA